MLPSKEFSAHRRLRPIWIAFCFCATACVALFFIPAFIIRPFRYQSPRALMVAMALRGFAPVLTLVTGVLCFVLAYELWRDSSRRRKLALAGTLLLVSFSAVMSRLNYFEWMFHPIDGPQFLAQSASKLDASELVMAIQIGGDARAYPISEMAYHHVLNDVVAGVPVAVTY